MVEVTEDLRKEKINELTGQLFGLLKEMNAEKDYSIKLFLFIISKLPRTIFVEPAYRTKGCFIQGFVQMFTDKENYFLSEQGKNDEAIINRSFHTDIELFRGPWIEALRFLLAKINESNSFLNRKQQQQLKNAARALST